MCRPVVSGRRDGEARGALRRHRRHEAGEHVVVKQHPAAFELAPADALDLDLDRRADRTALRTDDPCGHVEIERRLGEQTVALLDHHVVQEAEVLRCNEACRDASGLVALHRRDPVGGRRRTRGRDIRRCVTFQLPFTVRQTSSSSCSGGKPCPVTVTRRADRTMRGRDLELPDEAARRLRDRHLGSEIGRRAAPLSRAHEPSTKRPMAQASATSFRPPTEHHARKTFGSIS